MDMGRRESKNKEEPERAPEITGDKSTALSPAGWREAETTVDGSWNNYPQIGPELEILISNDLVPASHTANAQLGPTRPSDTARKSTLLDGQAISLRPDPNGHNYMRISLWPGDTSR